MMPLPFASSARRWWLSLAVLAWLVSLAGCGDAPVHRQQAYVFGTLVEVVIQGEPPEKAQAAAGEVLRGFDRMNRDFHAWKPGPLTALNAAFAKGETAPVSAELAAAIEDARRWWVASEGLFNPAIGRLIALWGFESDEFKPVRPDPAAIDKLVAAHPGMGDIVIAEGRAASRNPAVQLDFGGYAKGLALDRAAAQLKAAGIRNALINIGGNILALGRAGDRPWHVGIQHPRRAGVLAELDLQDGEAIGTSGDYQRYFEAEGRRYCHIIDPRTGWPVQGVQAVTVLVPPGPQAGVRSDVLSKPLFIAGPGAWRQVAEKLQVRQALLVDGEGRIFVTQGLARRLKFAPDVPKVVVVP
ncbi:FAD:protein FMN transferase [Thiobacter aerophilum]|uniref:FAD:protein FMN transferase n=1 Tax=Thiobacter aerophilum TaxID=3121275 RepID=A0ABV0EGF1_9BURK